MITARDELAHAVSLLTESEAEAALTAIEQLKRPRVSEAQIEQAIAGIACNKLNFPTLATRSSDSLDFRDCAVWQVKEALRAAFDAGVASAKPAECPLRNACPLCGESRIDFLALDEDDTVVCQTCGTTYDSNGEPEQV
jgi:rubredoxin